LLARLPEGVGGEDEETISDSWSRAVLVDRNEHRACVRTTDRSHSIAYFTVKFEFDYDGGGVGKGGTGQLFVNGQKVAHGRIEHTVPFAFSADETEDVGEDLGTPVSEDYKRGRQQIHRHDR